MSPRAETDSPEDCVRALYEVISGPPGWPRDWARFRRLCRPDARFVLATVDSDGRPVTQAWDVDGFIREGTEHFAVRGLWESELSGRTERFGRIAHVLSAYASRLDQADAPVAARGVNSVQLIWEPAGDGGAWLVAHNVWDRERPDLPLPHDLAGSDRA